MAEDNYKMLRAELDGKLKADSRLKAIAAKISAGTADFKDTSEYTRIVARYMGEVISSNIGSITTPLGKEMVCKALLRDEYESINGVLGEVQTSIDDKLGIHIKPVKPAFPTERVDKAAHSLEDATVPESTIKRRARSTSENITNSFHDDYIKENAKFRSKAGLKCYITRETDGKCCPWCSGIAGRYEYGAEPHDIYRRHDNCGCTVTYENGRQRQDVWSKRTWEAPEPNAGAEKPTVFTRDQAERLNAEQVEKVLRFEHNELTDGGESGIINIENKPITTIEQAHEFLKDNFASVEKNVSALDEQLIIDNTEQLRKLNERFGVLSSDNSGFISGSKVKALAETYNDPSSSRNDLILSSTYYKNPNNLLATEKIMQEKFHSMPVADEYLRVATITHEYGHMLENEIIRSRIKPEVFEEYQAVLAQGKRRQVALIPLRQQEKIIAHDIFDEIVAIAKENNPYFSLKENLSKYGRNSYFEAFAECFMNSQCGKPNELGKAMNIFLERSGYI